MLEISLALVFISCIAGYLVNKYIDKKFLVNIEADKSATVTALENQLKLFDQRINDTWTTISSTKQELESFKMVMGMKGIK